MCLTAYFTLSYMCVPITASFLPTKHTHLREYDFHLRQGYGG